MLTYYFNNDTHTYAMKYDGIDGLGHQPCYDRTVNNYYIY